MAEPPTTQANLLARIDERWVELRGLLSGLSPEQMEQPLSDGWSAKVHLVHLAAWEKSLQGLLRKQHRGEAMGLPRQVWDAHDLDATNAVIANTAGLHPLEAIVTASNATHAETVALLNSMSQEDLERPYSHYQPNDPPFNPAPVIAWVHGNTWEHYEEHIGWLKAGLKG